ncbi:hypothetical protein CDAR_68571 [Caerostris darwini]|uniref:Uncharacterized protein n=1 Tax=Caerostris darwini TaxID=1538125 RepID=A0AAV4PRD2_9ARAC|nr:hypothetical protein CDAR_68571 [Caerostris darwini]
MNSVPNSMTEALDCSESSFNRSFSPVCHRTRQQLKDKSCAHRIATIDLEVAGTLSDIVNNVSVAYQSSTPQSTPLRVAPTRNHFMVLWRKD